MSDVLRRKSVEIDSQVQNHARNLEKELEKLKRDLAEQQEIARAASAQGDRSENAEWQIANDNIARYTVSILTLSNTLDTLKAYTDAAAAHTESTRIAVGSTCRIRAVGQESSLIVKLYPEGLGNAKIGAISIATPMGQALLGHSAGDTVVVRAPVKDIPYNIEEVI